MKMCRYPSLIALALGAVLLGGCMVAKKPAPVVERSAESARAASKAGPQASDAAGQGAAARPETYVVKRGDTLYGIALDHGLDYRDLVRWNSITNPNVIEVGQVLRVRDPQAVAQSAVAIASPAPELSAGEVVTTPYQGGAPPIEGKAVGTDPARPTAPSAAPPAPLDPDVLQTPKAVKLPYSAAALASLQGSPAPAAKPAPSSPETSAAKQGEESDAVSWSWPTQGRIVAGFNENGGPKGLQIAGELGQPVLASAAGRVVYTGSGLRGYGNLVIIKHNNTYLSAYAHNRQILVKQGDNVSRGQRIAEMGNSDASQVMLHFEIRREGKPVDPAKFLPPS